MKWIIFLLKTQNKNKISANQNTYVYVHILACLRQMDVGMEMGMQGPTLPQVQAGSADHPSQMRESKAMTRLPRHSGWAVPLPS